MSRAKLRKDRQKLRAWVRRTHARLPKAWQAVIPMPPFASRRMVSYVHGKEAVTQVEAMFTIAGLRRTRLLWVSGKHEWRWQAEAIAEVPSKDYMTVRLLPLIKELKNEPSTSRDGMSTAHRPWVSHFGNP